METKEIKLDRRDFYNIMLELEKQKVESDQIEDITSLISDNV
jgi:hypothetical protein